MNGVVVMPTTNQPDYYEWHWVCEDCGEESSDVFRTSKVALADSEDHKCPADPLVAGQESLFGAA